MPGRCSNRRFETFTVCVNPVLDMIYHSPAFRVEGRHFFHTALTCAGGFGPNAARALKCLGESPRCLLGTAGHIGGVLRRTLTAEGIDIRNRRLDGTSRVATIWLSGQRSRMLVSPSPGMRAADLSGLFRRALAESSPADLILVGGSVTEDTEQHYLQSIAGLSRKRRYCCCDVRSSKWKVVCPGKPFILKLPSLRSARRLTKRVVASLDAAVEEGARVALCSTGPTSLLVRTPRSLLQVVAPRVRVVNPFGGGDCLMAVLAVALRRGRGARTALRMAAAAASASVLHPVPGCFEQDVAKHLSSKVHIHTLA